MKGFEDLIDMLEKKQRVKRVDFKGVKVELNDYIPPPTKAKIKTVEESVDEIKKQREARKFFDPAGGDESDWS